MVVEGEEPECGSRNSVSRVPGVRAELRVYSVSEVLGEVAPHQRPLWLFVFTLLANISDSLLNLS